MDGTNGRHLPAPPPVVPRGPHRGADPSGTVSVEIDDAERDVRVGDALRAALASVGDLPERALDGNPPPA